MPANLPLPGNSSPADTRRQPRSWTCMAWSPSAPRPWGRLQFPWPALETAAGRGPRWACRGNSVRERQDPCVPAHPDTVAGAFPTLAAMNHYLEAPSSTEKVHCSSVDNSMKPTWDETQLRTSWSELAGRLPVLSGPRKWGACTGAPFAASANPVACPQSGAVPTRVNCSRRLSGRWKPRLQSRPP